MDALYQEKILAHAKASRDQAPIDNADYTATLSNPVCGDRVTVKIAVDDAGAISNISTEVRGCALCEAGAGLFASTAPGIQTKDIFAVTTGFAKWLKGDDDAAPLRGMDDFTPVRAIKNRHKCVLLAYEAAVNAIGEAER